MKQVGILHISMILKIVELTQREGNVLIRELTPSGLSKFWDQWFSDLRFIDRAINDFGQENLPVTKGRVSDLISSLASTRQEVNDRNDVEKIIQEAYELGRIFTEELKSKSLLVLSPSEKAGYECLKPPFGDEVSRSFPDASYDLDEASRCFALERYTACVFHLMSALATPLEKLADKFGVQKSPDWHNWQKIISEIEQAIKRLPQQTDKEKEEHQYYQQAAESFWVMKDARRNPAMHGRGRCDVTQARQIWNSVEAFMQHLSKGLP